MDFRLRLEYCRFTESGVLMTLRELMIERILFSVSNEHLQKMYQVNDEEIWNLSDLDLFEVYENLFVENFGI